MTETDPGTVSARSHSDELIITNQTEGPIYYAVFGRQISARINWAMHQDPRLSIAEGHSKALRYDDIFQEEGGEDEFIVYWWHASALKLKHPVEALHSVVVRR